MKIRSLYVIIFCALISSQVKAQSSYEEFRNRVQNNYNKFKEQRNKEYEEFRNRMNAKYAALIKDSWERMNALKGIPKPKEDKPVPPTIYPEEDKNKPIKDNPLPYDKVIPVVKPKPSPKPVVPIEEDSRPVEKYFYFTYINTPLKVRLDNSQRFTMSGCNENEMSLIWERLSEPEYNNVINDCLRIREEHKLCDWAYLSMLDTMSKKFMQGRTNEATMFMAYIYSQSGYKMRLANDGSRIYMLYASRHVIYNKSYWVLDNEIYFPYDCDCKSLKICAATFPDEQPLSMQITSEQLLEMVSSPERTLKSRRYADVNAVVQTNENLIKFFNTYPTSGVEEDFGVRWAMYANTPLSEKAKSTLYPSLRRSIRGMNELDAVNRLLNFVQTAFVYEYDDKVWGHDRAFFADETLYYPYCDCEDRSILFSRIVRDLLGLEVVLIYYPGHLATAVKFNQQVSGDYIQMNGKRYVVCDPTFIGAPVGATMTNMDNSKAKVILL